MNPRRLYRSRDRQLAGVAGGMAEYLDIDPTVMRILWILAGLLSAGFAILAYIVLALVIPNAPWAMAPAGSPAAWGSAPMAPTPGWTTPTASWAPAAPGQGAPAATWAAYPPAAPGTSPVAAWATTGAAQTGGWSTAATAPQPRAEGRGFGAAGIVGVALIVIGGIALLNVAVPGWVVPAALGPLILIAIGAAFVLSSIRRTAPVAASTEGSGAAPPVASAEPAANAASTEATSVSDETTTVAVPTADLPEEDAGASPA